MDLYEKWSENRTKIPPGRYILKGLGGKVVKIWHEGKHGWGQSKKIVLWFEVVGGIHNGVTIPMFLTVRNNGKIPQGSKYFTAWCIANGLERPKRNRLDEMPLARFKNKVFETLVVDVKPRWNNGDEQPILFHYSRVDTLYNLFGEQVEMGQVK
jgi:hypothetical protein